jgi:demethylmenaquinone methyltransferase/2-methoxy-6-polyprenyl-1,4-benzoquinol methylase
MAEGDDKRRFVQGMFSEIAPSYDLLNSLMTMRLHRRWRRLAVAALELAEGQDALDVCCGTGDFMIPLRRAVGGAGRVVGVDFCAPMVQIARRKLGSESSLLVGDACSMPFASDSFDAVTVGWGLRNVPDLALALKEIRRVLRPGGKFVTLDMARPMNRWVGRVSEVAFHRAVPALGRLFGKGTAYKYLPKSAERFVSREQMSTAMNEAGFVEVRHRDFGAGNVCMHWGTACR